MLNCCSHRFLRRSLLLYLVKTSIILIAYNRKSNIIITLCCALSSLLKLGTVFLLAVPFPLRAVKSARPSHITRDATQILAEIPHWVILIGTRHPRFSTWPSAGTTDPHAVYHSDISASAILNSVGVEYNFILWQKLFCGELHHMRSKVGGQSKCCKDSIKINLKDLNINALRGKMRNL